MDMTGEREGLMGRKQFITVQGGIMACIGLLHEEFLLFDGK